MVVNRSLLPNFWRRYWYVYQYHYLCTLRTEYSQLGRDLLD